jgi:hypothetical protein
MHDAVRLSHCTIDQCVDGRGGGHENKRLLYKRLRLGLNGLRCYLSCQCRVTLNAFA